MKNRRRETLLDIADTYAEKQSEDIQASFHRHFCTNL